MNSFRPNENRLGRRRLLAATALALLLLLADVLSGGVLRHALRGAAGAVWEVGAGGFSRIGASGFFMTRASLAAQNAALSAQVEKLQQNAAAYSAAEAENEQLRALAHLASLSPGITAPVISSYQASPFGTFAIGAGTADGVHGGALVLSPDGYAVGRVSDASPRQSLVVGIFAPGQSIDVVIHGVPLTLKGQGGGVASGEAPRASAISVGDAALAPGLGELPVGVVGYVADSPASASTRILARVPTDLGALTYLYVETAR